MNEPALEADGLYLDVEGKRLVDNVSLEVFPGDVVAVVGPSGAGKSSLLRLMNRLDEPTSGTVWIQGRDYRTIPPNELRSRVGMVMQSAHLFPGTVADNLQYGPRQRDEELTSQALEELLSQVNLEGFAGRDVTKLSGGEAQRVSLARSLANQPEVLLLDEPTSSLDEANQADVESLISQIIRDRGLTCVVVTHDRDQARRVATLVAVMEAGRVVALGPAREVLGA
jgi:putative ABC transport system ATP-binding protein